MQTHPFDSVAKTLGRTGTRRGVVRTLSKAVAAAILAGRRDRSVGAQSDTCPSGLEECFEVFGSPKCVDTSSDPEHCGSCDHSCRADQTCVSGSCVCTPSPLFESLEECFEVFGSPKCVDTSSDPEHCGSCDHSCRAGEACRGGTCVPATQVPSVPTQEPAQVPVVPTIEPARDDEPPLESGPSDESTSAAYEVIRLGPEAWTWSSADDLSEDGRVLGAATTANGDDFVFLWKDGAIVDLTDLSRAFYAEFADDDSVVVTRFDAPDAVYQPESGTFAPYEWPDLPTVDPPPGFAIAETSDINSRGEIAGTLYPVSVDDLEGVRGFVASNGTVTVLEPAPGGDTSATWMITDAGQVMGGPLETYELDRPYYLDGRAFLYDLRTGEMTDLGTLPGFEGSFPWAMNTAGAVVGEAWRRRANGRFVRRAFLYDPVTAPMVDLNDRIPAGSGWVLTAAIDINEAGQIVGEGVVGGRTQAFLLNP